MENKKIWACLCYLGYNMWADYEEKDGVKGFYYGQDSDVIATPRLRFQREAWDRIVEMLKDAGCNMIVLDVGEGIRFDCCPEIAAEDAWTKDEMKAELARLRGMGFEVIPKLNFSTCHDEWMGLYCRMISTPQYYDFCKAIIKECAELFDTPRFFHIGYDEEGIECQRKYNLAIIRQGDLWWHDFEFICDCVREAGCRPWIWADYIWNHTDEFLKRMKKDVLMSNWYYGEFPADYSDPGGAIHAYTLLAEHGFDQIPGGSNWGRQGNLQDTAEFMKLHADNEHLLGFLQTIWYPNCVKYLHRYEGGISDLRETREKWEAND